jgi:hypothetical protein
VTVHFAPWKKKNCLQQHKKKAKKGVEYTLSKYEACIESMICQGARGNHENIDDDDDDGIDDDDDVRLLVCMYSSNPTCLYFIIFPSVEYNNITFYESIIL